VADCGAGERAGGVTSEATEGLHRVERPCGLIEAIEFRTDERVVIRLRLVVHFDVQIVLHGCRLTDMALSGRLAGSSRCGSMP
jgi:hypothetical protein